MNQFLKRLFFGNSVLQNIIYAALYIILFSYVWKSYCVPVWHSFNYKDIPHSFAYNLVGYLIALFPIIFYRGIVNISSWISVILYYFGYVPIILGLLFNFPEVNDYHITAYWIVLFIAMSMFFYSDRILIKVKRSRQKVSTKVIWIFATLTLLIQLVLYHNNMRIVDFRSIYELRAENAAVVSGIFGYINSWSGSIIFPFIFIHGLFRRDKNVIIVGILSFLFLYSIFGAKSDLFAPLILYGFYKFFQWQEKNNINLLSILTLGISFLSILLLSTLDNEASYLLAAVFLVRTVTISGVLFSGFYLPFFQNNPYTYFSHINIVNAITSSNPYEGTAIGNVVTEGGANANAIFWAMDGVAAMGATGVAIISFLFLLFLIFINGLATKQNKFFLSILMVVPIMALLNTSFFSFLLSEGVFLIILIMLFFDIRYDNMFLNENKSEFANAFYKRAIQ